MVIVACLPPPPLPTPPCLPALITHPAFPLYTPPPLCIPPTLPSQADNAWLLSSHDGAHGTTYALAVGLEGIDVDLKSNKPKPATAHEE